MNKFVDKLKKLAGLASLVLLLVSIMGCNLYKIRTSLQSADADPALVPKTTDSATTKPKPLKDEATDPLPSNTEQSDASKEGAPYKSDDSAVDNANNLLSLVKNKGQEINTTQLKEQFMEVQKDLEQTKKLFEAQKLAQTFMSESKEQPLEDNNFLHLLADSPIDANTASIWLNLFAESTNKIPIGRYMTDTNDLAMVNLVRPNQSGIMPLVTLLSDNRGLADDEDKLKEVMLAIVKTDINGYVISKIRDKDMAKKLLSTILQNGEKDDLSRVFQHLQDDEYKHEVLIAVVEWSIEHYDKATKDGGKVVDIFNDTYGAYKNIGEWEKREVMRNGLIAQAYDIGKRKSNDHDVELAIDQMAKIIESGFFTKDSLKSNNFSSFREYGTLLYIVLDKANRDCGKITQKMVQSLAFVIKTRLGDNESWQNYLSNENNTYGEKSILSLVAGIAGSEEMAKSKEWLDY